MGSPLNILIDYHHFHKYLGLHQLFEERLGYKLYYMRGTDWAERGYWAYSEKPHVIQSLLEDTFKLTLDKEEKFNGRAARLCNLPKIDVIAPTVPCNIEPLRRFVKDQGISPKELFISGNNFPACTLVGIKNLLTAATAPLQQNDCHKCFFHQQFDLALFKPNFECKSKSVLNLQHYIDKAELELLLRLEKAMPDWEFKIHGCGNRDGGKGNFPEEAAELIRNFGFLFHVKRVDEGYGFNAHYALACGKPLIIGSSSMFDYWTKTIPNTLSSKFTENTTIDVDKLSFDGIIDKLERMESMYEHHSNWTYEKFKEMVNFDKETEEVRLFMETLV